MSMGLIPRYANVATQRFRTWSKTLAQLLGMVPQPVKAVVLLFPINTAYETTRKEEDTRALAGGLPPIDNTILWIKQTVRF